MKSIRPYICMWIAFLLILCGSAPATSTYFDVSFMAVTDTATAGSLRIAGCGQTAAIYYSATDATVVGIAANALRDDVERVTGLIPTVSSNTPSASDAILIGTIGSSPLIDGLIAAGVVLDKLTVEF